jgi:antirestriction protein ArdC
VESDTVAVDADSADADGMGGDDGYYAVLLEELLHATGHPRRLNRATTGDYSAAGHALEEGTVAMALRIVLAEIGFPPEALDWHARDRGLPANREAARRAAAWVLGTEAA